MSVRRKGKRGSFGDPVEELVKLFPDDRAPAERKRNSPRQVEKGMPTTGCSAQPGESRPNSPERFG